MDPEGSAEQRFAVLKTAARIIADHPVLGIGLGAYHNANADYSPDLGMKDTHNTYMNVAAETGVPGLILFLALVGSVLLSARAARRGAGPAAAAQAEEVRWLQYSVTGYLVAAVIGFSQRFASAGRARRAPESGQEQVRHGHRAYEPNTAATRYPVTEYCSHRNLLRLRWLQPGPAPRRAARALRSTLPRAPETE